MVMARWQGHLLDDNGNVVEAASISVLKESDGLPAALKSDRAGATPISNPIVISAGSKGYFGFHVAGGAYRITATAANGGAVRDWRYVPIGLGAESDALAATPLREVLSANRTIYVRTTGLDSNDGLTSGTAYLTIQKALDAVSVLDTYANSVTVDIGAGTFSPAAAHTLKRPVGASTVTITGAGATTIIAPTASNCFQGISGGTFLLQNMKLQRGAGSGHGIFCQNGTLINISGIEFGSLAAGRHMFATQNGVIVATGDYTITGGGQMHVSASSGGYIQVVNRTVTLTGTPAFSLRTADTFICGTLQLNGTTWTGSATGTRYLADANGAIYTAGGGASFIPGNAAGSVTNGGQYT